MFKKLVSFIVAIVILTTSSTLDTKAAEPFVNGLAEQLKFAPPIVNITKVGYGIQRTMRLLETSSADNKNTVRIAFCGQSITDGNPWTVAIIAYLKNKYPNADIQSKNFGIGGYNTWLQQNIIENDITSFYPDLVFFYDYGDMGIYENMIRLIREKTVSEVVIQNDHLDNGNGEFGTDEKSFTSLPSIANRSNCELADIRTNWKKYLDVNNLNVSDMLSDQKVHLNPQGQALMYEILKQYLVYKPVDEKTYDDRTTKYFVGKDVNWADKKLSLPFRGNRMEVVSPSQTGAGASVLVNSKKPSDYVELCNNTRYSNLTSHVFSSYFMKIEFLKPTKPQTWEMEFTRVVAGTKISYDYKITGSITGFDGSGNTSQDFTTDSGTMFFGKNYFYSLSPLAVGNKLIFETTLNGTNQLTFNGVEKIASNLPSITNTLILQNTTDVVPNITYFRSYRPGFLLAAPVVNTINKGAISISGSTNIGANVNVSVNGSSYSGLAGRDGLFSVTVPPVAGGVIVDVTSKLDGISSQLFRYTLDGVMPTPVVKKINLVYSNSTKVTGAATNNSSVAISVGTKIYKGTASSTTGYFSITIPKCKPGTIIKVKASLYSINSSVKTVTVKVTTPKINKITIKSKTISGTAYPLGIVKITYDNKNVYSVKVTSKGTFSISLKNKIVFGKIILASVKYGGQTSAITKIKVIK